jgi:hypothetical protein
LVVGCSGSKRQRSSLAKPMLHVLPGLTMATNRFDWMDVLCTHTHGALNVCDELNSGPTRYSRRIYFEGIQGRLRASSGPDAENHVYMVFHVASFDCWSALLRRTSGTLCFRMHFISSTLFPGVRRKTKICGGRW